MAEVDETSPTATPALPADEIEARGVEVLMFGELDDETVASIETAIYGDDGQPMPGGGLKQMLGDMAVSGVWGRGERRRDYRARLIPWISAELSVSPGALGPYRPDATPRRP